MESQELLPFFSFYKISSTKLLKLEESSAGGWGVQPGHKGPSEELLHLHPPASPCTQEGVEPPWTPAGKKKMQTGICSYFFLLNTFSPLFLGLGFWCVLSSGHREQQSPAGRWVCNHLSQPAQRFNSSPPPFPYTSQGLATAKALVKWTLLPAAFCPTVQPVERIYDVMLEKSHPA